MNLLLQEPRTENMVHSSLPCLTSDFVWRSVLVTYFAFAEILSYLVVCALSLREQTGTHNTALSINEFVHHCTKLFAITTQK